jgi:hypothetical protein
MEERDDLVRELRRLLTRIDWLRRHERPTPSLSLARVRRMLGTLVEHLRDEPRR